MFYMCKSIKIRTKMNILGGTFHFLSPISICHIRKCKTCKPLAKDGARNQQNARLRHTGGLTGGLHV